MAGDYTSPPILKIIPLEQVHPHEVHDPQRSRPLIERLKKAEYLTNPIMVAPGHQDGHYVVLDGSNRYHSFSSLGFSRILAQVVSYESDDVELAIWHHAVSHINDHLLITEIEKIPDVTVTRGWADNEVASIILRDGIYLTIQANVESKRELSRVLRDVVDVYQKNGILHRTPSDDPKEVWRAFPDATAYVRFPLYQPTDILAAPEHGGLLPPGISRHIIHGRALRVNYPLSLLKDDTTPLEEANTALRGWLQDKVETRAVRYYAESTYQFDE